MHNIVIYDKLTIINKSKIDTLIYLFLLVCVILLFLFIGFGVVSRDVFFLVEVYFSSFFPVITSSIWCDFILLVSI